MANSTLLLGPILFQDFELPASIAWGGKQAVTIHCLPGGTRIIDAMGRDDADITWSGIFSGPDAGLRARAVDLMRADGSLWPLSWDSYFYSVVVRRFEADYRRPNWIPYKIACVVLRDEAEEVVETALSLATGLATDLAAASAFNPALDLSQSNQTLATSGATTAGTAAYSQALSQLGDDAVETATQLGSVGARLIGTSDVGQAVTLAGQAAQLAASGGYLQRAARNLANASN